MATESVVFDISTSAVSWGRLVPLVFCLFFTWLIISSVRYLHVRRETTATTDLRIFGLTVGGCVLTIILALSAFSGFHKRAICIQNFNEQNYSTVEGPISNYRIEGKFPEYYQSFSVDKVHFELGKLSPSCGFTVGAFGIGVVGNGTYVRIIHNHGAIYSVIIKSGEAANRKEVSR